MKRDQQAAERVGEAIDRAIASEGGIVMTAKTATKQARPTEYRGDGRRISVPDAPAKTATKQAQRTPGPWTWNDVLRANDVDTQLILAAPVLLAALREMVDAAAWFTNVKLGTPDLTGAKIRAARERALAAITRATEA